MKVYLAGPMAGCTDYEMHEWREAAKTALLRANIECLDPTRHDYRGLDLRKDPVAIAQLVNSDKADIRAADLLLVWHDRPSVGTAQEVLYAYERSKPIFIVNVLPDPAAISPWMLHHSNIVADSLKEAVAMVLDFVSMTRDMKARFKCEAN